MHRSASTIIAVVTLGTGLLWPFTMVRWHGWTMVAPFYETVAYRYIYTLRQLYESDTYTVTPQGQVTNLVYLASQLVVSALGSPPTEIFPRWDIVWSMVVVSAHLASIAAFLWATAPIRSLLARLVVALAVVVVFVIPDVGGANLLLAGDYITYLLPVPLLALGCFLRDRACMAPWTPRQALGLGVLAGLAAGVKVSLLIFPMVVGLWWLLARPKPVRSVALGIVASAVGGVAYLLVLVANYLGRVDQVGRFFTDIRIVSNGLLAGLLQERGDQTYLEWLVETVTHPVHTGVYTLVLLAPVLLLLWLPVVRSRTSRAALAAFVVGAAAYQYAIVYRPGAPLYCEGVLFLLVVVAALCHLTGFPAGACVGPLKGEARWSLLGAGVLLVLIAWHLPARVADLVNLGAYSDEQHALDAALARLPERVTILPPDGGWLLDPVGVAITRGSTTIYGRSFASNALWGGYLDKHAVYDPFRQAPPDLTRTSVLVWSFAEDKPDLTREQTMASLAERFKLSFEGYEPVVEIPSVNRTVVIMTRQVPQQRP